MKDNLLKSKVVDDILVELVFAHGRRFAIKVDGKYDRWFLKETDAKECFENYRGK